MRLSHIRNIVPALLVCLLPLTSNAGVSIGISVNVAPPPLPVYVQPACPGAGYIWTPGYWAWGDGDYYWVPGTWVLAPAVGLLWTPGYWGWGGGVYLWHAGYWGPHVGFYGGVNYGFGYTGVGFAGGYWHGGAFYYNRSVSNVSVVNVTNVYNRTVVNNNVTVNRVSYNGGHGGIDARPTGRELAAEHEHHVAFTPMQREHEQMASHDPGLHARENHGRPAIAATSRPAVFSGRGVSAAHAPGGPGNGFEGGRGPRTDRPPQAMQHGPDHMGGGSDHSFASRPDRPPSAQHGAPSAPREAVHGYRPQQGAPQAMNAPRAHNDMYVPPPRGPMPQQSAPPRPAGPPSAPGGQAHGGGRPGGGHEESHGRSHEER
jgi:hypothetical protein